MRRVLGGGWWNFYDLSNGGCYLAPGGVETFHLKVMGNGFDGRLSANATGITVTLFALSHLAFRFPSVPTFSDRFY
jgi:Antirestriction protein